MRLIQLVSKMNQKYSNMDPRRNSLNIDLVMGIKYREHEGARNVAYLWHTVRTWR